MLGIAQAEKCGSGQRRLAVHPPIRTGESQSASRCKHAPFLSQPGSSADLSLFIGIDNGPAQIADAVKTPGVILFDRHLTWD